jgi:hypothetical protein
MHDEKPAPAEHGAPTGPICLACAKPMKLSQITPVIFSYVMDDHVFACAKCDTKLTRREQRRPCR